MSKQKILAGAAILISLLFLLSSPAWAGGLGISCGIGGCALDTSDPLFSENEIYPGWSVTKSIKVKNSYPEDRRFAISVEEATFTDATPPLSEVLTITITEQESATVVYGSATIKDWKDSGFTALSTIPTGGERNYDLSIALSDVGNDYQGKVLGFNLNLGFESLPPGPTPPLPGGLVSGIATAWGGPVGTLGGAAEGYEGKIVGEGISHPPETEGVASGEGATACQDPLWWPLAILLQLLATYVIHRQIWERGRRRRWALTTQATAAVAAVVLLTEFFCPWWLPLIGAVIGMIAVYLGLRKVAAL